jgi:hypothetical protein
MSEVISFRLDPNNPREAQALGVLASFQERGYSARHILTEALLKFDHAGIEHELQAQMAEILAAMNKVGDQIERLQRTGVSRTELRDEKQAALAEAFVLSVKSAVKPGITLES